MKRRRNDKTLLDGMHRARQCVGLAWTTALLVLATMLACAPIARALIIEGDPVPPACADGISASLSATPPVIDPNTSSTSTLTWSVELPPHCTMSLGLSLTGVGAVGQSGTRSIDVPATRIYTLRALLWPGQPELATTTITVLGDPGVISVSDGPEITADDISQFNAKWMQPPQKIRAYLQAVWNLYDQNPRIVWEVGERMAALVRMYELTSDNQYLDHLKEDFIECALRYRDDYHPGAPPVDENGGNYTCASDTRPPVPPTDEFRGQTGLAAWSGKTLITAGKHLVDEVSFMYAYPIAAFARIVAEDPALHGPYGADAVRYANEMIKTVRVFLPQLTFRRAGDFTEATLTVLDIFRTMPTDAECEEAYAKAVTADPEAANSDNQEMRDDCLALDKGAGVPMAHNWNFAFMRVLIELWRVLDTPWYQRAPGADSTAGQLRDEIPLLVSRLQRYFANRLATKVESGYSPYFFWHYNDDLPDSIPTYPEDTSHGALDMNGLEVLRRNFVRLNAAAAAAGEPIPLYSVEPHLFAQTFLQKIDRGWHFARNVASKPADPADKYNFACDGWLHLAEAAVQVYHACYETSLRVVGGWQPYLAMGNHSGLLMNKRWLPGLSQFAVWANAPNARAVSGDFNGDGRADIALVGAEGWTTIPVAFSQGDGTFAVSNAGRWDFAGWASAPGVQVVAGDVNGDGRADLIATGGSGWWTIPVAYSNGDGTFDVSNLSNWPLPEWAQAAGVKALAGDVDGDGRADLLLTGGAGWWTIPVGFSNGDGTFRVTNHALDEFPIWAQDPYAQASATDLNGDGRTDIVLAGGDSWTTVPMAFSRGDGSFWRENRVEPNISIWSQGIGATLLTGDVNGDQRGDVVLTGGADWVTIPVGFSNGNGTLSVSNAVVSAFPTWAQDPSAKAVAGDFNGDGRADLALVGGNDWWTVPVAFSHGDGTFTVTNFPVP